MPEKGTIQNLEETEIDINIPTLVDSTNSAEMHVNPDAMERGRSKAAEVIYDSKKDLEKALTNATIRKREVISGIKEKLKYYLSDNEVLRALANQIGEARRQNKSTQKVIREYVKIIIKDILNNVNCGGGECALVNINFPEEPSALIRRIEGILSGVQGVLVEEFEILKFIPEDTESLSEGQAMEHHASKLKWEAVSKALEIRSDISDLLGRELVENGIYDNITLVGAELGKGGYGTVHSCDIGGERVAIKVSHKNMKEYESTSETEDVLNSEDFINTTLKSPYLVSQYGVIDVDYTEIIGDNAQHREGVRQLELSEVVEGANNLQKLMYHEAYYKYASKVDNPDDSFGDLFKNGYFDFKQRDDIEKAEFNEFLELYFLQILFGVKAMHDSGYVHRDLKLENVFVAENDSEGGRKVVIGDFGLVRHNGYISPDKGNVSGTPAYMSPEQIDNTFITVKSDIYALGKILYELVGGKKAENSWATMRMNLDGIDLSDLNIPENVKKVISGCLELEPENRPTIDELIKLIKELITDGKRFKVSPTSESVTLKVAAYDDEAGDNPNEEEQKEVA